VEIRVDLRSGKAQVDLTAAFRDLGIVLGEEASAALTNLVGRQDEVVSWLTDSEDARDRFRADPVGALAERFPEYHLGQASLRVPPAVTDSVLFNVVVSDPAMNLFRQLAAYVSASAANLARFENEPFAVLDEQAVGFASGPVAQVHTALIHALGIATIDGELAAVRDLALRRP
jgi:hypothetical protein